MLSASKPQSVELIDVMGQLKQAMGFTAEIYQEPFSDDLGATDILATRVQFPNGSRVIALPANPRTARGYPGNAVLDEFAHAPDPYAIWAAIARQVALGHKIRVLSTPKGEQGKFFDLAREFGVADGVAPTPNPKRTGPWSIHWIDVHMAIAEGCPISVQEMRDLFRDDELFSQEFLCVFLKATGAWLTLDLIAICEDAGATLELAPDFSPRGPLFFGIDVGRDHDATTLWLDEKIGDVMWTRAVIWKYAMPFPQQARELNPIVRMCTRGAIDKTGMGVGLFDDLNELGNQGRLMGVNFAGSNDQGVKMKTDLAIRIKKRFELRKVRVPYFPQIRTELQAVKREATGSGVTFDAPRIQVEAAVAGKNKKVFAHADAFWAKALSEFAADGGICEQGMTAPNEPSAFQGSRGYQ